MLRSLLIGGALLAAAAGANAQAWVSDSITMGPGYGNDVFYSMSNGTVSTESNKNWTIAFQTTKQVQGPGPAVSVWANHVQDTVSVWSVHKGAGMSFDALSAADTVGKTKLYNSAKNWKVGAFNRNVDLTNPVDFGWGIYDFMGGTHAVLGDSVYLVQTGDDLFKLWIEKYETDIDLNSQDTSKWIFRIARFDGSEDTTITINRFDYDNKNFAYYEARNRNVLDREPSNTTWDILFTRYIDSLDLGGGLMDNPTTGVLLNYSVSAAKVLSVSPDTVNYSNYGFSSDLNAIGFDWKMFDMSSFMYVTDTNRTYFVKTAAGTYWQMVFTGFTSGGGPVGSKTYFNKRMIQPAAVQTVSNATMHYAVAPTPASNQATLMLDAAKADNNAQLVVTDINGRALISQQLPLQQGMNAYTFSTANMPAGMYLLNVQGQDFRISQKLAVAH